MTCKGLLSGIFMSLTAILLPLGDTVSASEKDDIKSYQKFGAFLSDFRKGQSIRALTAVIVKDGEIVWEQALGTSDDEGDMPTTMDTTFGIASVTKPIAATAILAEAEKGGLFLDWLLANDPRWADFCGWFSASGIPFGGGGNDSDGTAIPPVDCTRKLSLSDSLNMRVNGAAGSAFVYNPMTYARIDRAIEGAGGRPLREIVRDNVLKKAGMENVALGWHDPEGGSALRLLAPPFTVQEDGRDVKASHSDDDFRAAAGIRASARHVAQFDIALDSGKLLSVDWMGRIFSDDTLPPRGDYRWGWFAQDWQGKRLYWHSGWEPDRYSAIYLKIPEEKLTLILLANNENLWWANPLTAAEIHKSPVVAEFLKAFVAPYPP